MSGSQHSGVQPGPGQGTQAPSPRLDWRRELLLVALILLAAGFLRLYRLDTIPPGLTHDEADTGYFVKAVFQGAPSQVETPYGYANEPFTMYSAALFMAVFGANDLALRLHSAFFGLVMIGFGYMWVRTAFDVPTALGAAALTALSFWPLATARFALNPQPAPALFAGAVWFLWLALFDRRPARQRWWAWLLFALLLAGSLWAYEVARATTAALFLLVLLLLLTDWARLREHGHWLLGSLSLGLILAAPHLLDPSAWERSGTLATTLNALKAGDPGPLLNTALEALGTFSVRGDPFITYNPPGRPIFNWAVGLLFYAGLLLCVKRWRRPACAFILFWIGTGLLPSMIVGAWNSTLHSMGMQFVVFVPPALFAVAAARWLRRRYGSRPAQLALAVFLALVVWTGLGTFNDYLNRWGQWPEVRAAYFHNLAAITDYLDATPFGGTVTLSSPFPDLPHDPFVADLRVQRDDLALRWFDGRRALLLPPAEQSLLILPTSAPLASTFDVWVPTASAERVFVHPEDVDPYFDVLLWHPDRTWSAILDRLPGSGVLADPPVDLPVNFGDVVELVGYDLGEAAVAPGTDLSVLTAWRVLDPLAFGPVPPQRYGRAAAIFVHLLDRSGEVVAQEDRLDVPAWNWERGDRFLQLHRLVLDAALPPGTYNLEVGLYTRPEILRLSVLVEGGIAGDHVSLQAIKVGTP